jgi:hypothetical protein
LSSLPGKEWGASADLAFHEGVVEGESEGRGRGLVWGGIPSGELGDGVGGGASADPAISAVKVEGRGRGLVWGGVPSGEVGGRVGGGASADPAICRRVVGGMQGRKTRAGGGMVRFCGRPRSAHKY